MGKVVLIGAGGFLGRHVHAALDRHEVLCVSRSAHEQRDWVAMDLATCGTADLARRLRQFAPEVVINCAGVISGSACAMTSGNVVIVATLLDALAEATPGVRLVQLGSAAEYGSKSTRQPVGEATPAVPTSTYGVTKLAATQLVLTSTALGDVDGVVLRLFNPVGPGMSEETLPGRAARALQSALEDHRPEVTFGSLDAVRDYMDARDAADAVVAAAFVREPTERLLNCGTGDPTSSRELVDLLARIARYEGTVTEDWTGSARSTGVPWQAADTRLAEQVLGWKARRSIDEALGSLWTAFSSARP